MSADYCLYLIACIWAVFALVVFVAARCDGRVPADDIGVMFLFALCIYGTVPPLSWIWQDQVFDVDYGGRLYLLQPSAEENATLLELYLGLAAGFALVYIARRGSVERPKPKFAYMLEEPLYRAALFLMLLGVALDAMVMLFGVAQGGGTYIDQYRIINELPLFLRQALKIIEGITAVAKTIVLVGLLQRLPKSWPLLVAYVISIFLSYDPEGARTTLIMGILTLLAGWHVLVRPIPALAWLSMAAGGLVFFQFAGTARDLGNWTEAQQLGGPLLRFPEMDSIWANGIDILRFRSLGGTVAPNILYEELYSFLPSQLLPFEKLSLSVWFVNEFYYWYAQQGGGWAFGVAAQCASGYGLAEAVLRGAILGMIALWLIKKYRQAAAWWVLPLYLYIFTFTYKSIRVSSFALLEEIVQFAVPVILLLGLYAANPAQRNNRGSAHLR